MVSKYSNNYTHFTTIIGLALWHTVTFRLEGQCEKLYEKGAHLQDVGDYQYKGQQLIWYGYDTH